MPVARSQALIGAVCRWKVDSDGKLLCCWVAHYVCCGVPGLGLMWYVISVLIWRSQVSNMFLDIQAYWWGFSSSVCCMREKCWSLSACVWFRGLAYHDFITSPTLYWRLQILPCLLFTSCTLWLRSVVCPFIIFIMFTEQSMKRRVNWIVCCKPYSKLHNRTVREQLYFWEYAVDKLKQRQRTLILYNLGDHYSPTRLWFSLTLPHVIMHDKLQISAPCIWRGIAICTGEKTTA